MSAQLQGVEAAGRSAEAEPHGFEILGKEQQGGESETMSAHGVAPVIEGEAV
jgi:hypothetical protein